VGVITAAIVGLLGLLAAWASEGGLVHFLGGVTKGELDAALKNLRAPLPGQGPGGASVGLCHSA
jgi:hypothetical protein